MTSSAPAGICSTPRPSLLALMRRLGRRADAQDRLKAMPGYPRFQARSREIPGSVKLGALNGTWRDGGKAFEYRKDGKTYRYDIAARKAEEAKTGGEAPRHARPAAGSAGAGAGRGQQVELGRSRPTGPSRRSIATGTSGSPTPTA